MEDNIKMKGDKGKRKGKKQNINTNIYSSKHIRIQEQLQEKPKKNNESKKK